VLLRVTHVVYQVTLQLSMMQLPRYLFMKLFVYAFILIISSRIALRICKRILLLQHSYYRKTTVPVRLIQSTQLARYHEHIVHLKNPLSSALQVSYTLDNNICKQKNLFISETILFVNSFRCQTSLFYDPPEASHSQTA
jgi:hypothetical protein